MKLTSTTTVLRPPEEVYAFWRDLAGCPPSWRIWTRSARPAPAAATGEPAHRSVRPWSGTPRPPSTSAGERIGWRSVGDADIRTPVRCGSCPPPGTGAPRSTSPSVYDVPAGPLGRAVAKYFGEEPHQQLDDDLRRFKQVIETGEVVRSDGAPGGKRARQEFPQHPARPLSDEELAEVRS